jgi:flagellar protein FliS
MYGKSNALASYGKVANAETSPLHQTVMLYDGAIKFLRLAAADIESNEIAQKAEHVNRALDILNYLQSILDFQRGGDVAHTLDRLYTIVTMKMLSASAKLDAQAMHQTADLLVPVRESWNTIANAAPEQVPVSNPVGVTAPQLGSMVSA